MFACLAVLVISLLAVLPSSADAQQAALEVLVRDAESAEPLAGALVRLEGLDASGITDSRGSLRLTLLSSGPRAVEVSLLGFAVAQSTVQIAPDRVTALEFELRRAPIAIEPVDVVARSGRLTQSGFFDRMEGGQGTFFTRADIDKMRPRYLSDVLRRAAGLRLTPTRTGARANSRGAPPGCAIQYYLNGILAPYFDVDQILPGDVEGLEIYRGSATIPPAFNRGTAICGVIVIWTRVG
jgi:outer membrane receptor for ferrienterochelin and colicins